MTLACRRVRADCNQTWQCIRDEGAGQYEAGPLPKFHKQFTASPRAFLNCTIPTHVIQRVSPWCVRPLSTHRLELFSNTSKSGEVCLCTNSYVRCAHRPAGLCTPTCSAHRPAQHTDPLCMQIFTAHQPACLLLSFRSKLPKFSFYVLRFAHPNVSKVLLKI